MNKLAGAITKIAKLKLSAETLERQLGIILTREQLKKLQAYLDQEIEKSYSLQHPWVTGIPSLGLAPAIAASNAYSTAQTNIIRDYPAINKAIKEAQREKMINDVFQSLADRVTNPERF